VRTPPRVLAPAAVGGHLRETVETAFPSRAAMTVNDSPPCSPRVLGPEHPDTLTTRGNLAYWAREAGDDVDTGEN
jgi:hypothetical protein